MSLTVLQVASRGGASLHHYPEHYRQHIMLALNRSST